MRILLTADVHANGPALEAVREPFDACLFLGDLVDYGPDPRPCLEWVRANAAHCVRGNHDHGAAHGVAVYPASRCSFKALTLATRSWGRSLMTEADRRMLAAWPAVKLVTLAGLRFLLVHGSPRDPLDEFAPAEVEFWRKRLEGFDVDVVCCGHTHQQYAITVGDTLVVNPGSVGLPREGDPRAAYAILDGGKVLLRRVEYDVEETVRQVEASRIDDDAKELLTTVYRTGELPLPSRPALVTA